MELILVRHGQTELNKMGRSQGRSDPALTETGFRQAEHTGQRLVCLGIERMFCSDLTRVRQTTAVINRWLGVPVAERPDLREIDMGCWEGLAVSEVAARDPEFYARWARHGEDLPYPGGECGADVYRRAVRVVDEALSSGLERIAIITSGGVIRALLCGFLSLDFARRFQFATDNCGLTIVEYRPASRFFQLCCVNDTAHLVGIES